MIFLNDISHSPFQFALVQSLRLLVGCAWANNSIPPFSDVQGSCVKKLSALLAISAGKPREG